MTTLKDLLKTIDIKKLDWGKFDWGSFDCCFRKHQEDETVSLNQEEVIKLNIIQGSQSIYDSRNLKERRRNLREHKNEYEKNIRERRKDTEKSRGNLGALKSSYSSLNPLKKPAFRMSELEKVEPQSRSGRTYYYSAVFRNAAVLRLLVKKFTRYLREHKKNLGEPSWVHNRIIDQMDSEARSIVANIREGYGRPTTLEYVQFLGYSKGSLEELRGDVFDLRDDGLLKSVPGSGLASIGINLIPPKNPPNSSYDHLKALKRIIEELRGEALTFEIFMELVNKTDYLLRRTVEGLREKIIDDKEAKLKQELDNIYSKYW